MSAMSINEYNSSPMKIAQLGECTDLWSELNKSPRSVLGGFTLNLADLRRLTGDSATMSTSLDHFLDNCLYIRDNNQNPDGFSICELYRRGANVEAVFDPLLSVELDWNSLEAPLNQTGDPDAFRSINYEEMLDQVQTRIALFANRPLQRRLIRCLRAKQKEYYIDQGHDGSRAGAWYHFHQRIQDFWKIAFEVCLGKKTEPSLAQRGASNEMLDWIFLSNNDNLAAYRHHIYTLYETERHTMATLNDLYALVDRICRILGKESRGKVRPANYKNTVLEVIEELYDRWSVIWETDHRPIFDTPLARSFRENMASIDSYFLYELIPLSTGSRRLTPKIYAEVFGSLRELLWTAIDTWKNLISRTPKTIPGDPVIAGLKEKLDEIIQYMDKSVIDISDPTAEDSSD